MDKATRQELKTDHFALEVQHGVEYVADHRKQLIRYGIIAAAVVIAVIAVVSYLRYQKSVREDALSAALKIENASVGAGASDYTLSFPTAAEREKAATKAFNDIATRYSGTDEGELAEYYLAGQAADQGNMAEAERRFKGVADSGSDYSSLAKLALAEIYHGQGKDRQAQALVKGLIDKPAKLVSKEEATIMLAKLVAPTNPAEARKLLEPLRTSPRTAVSRNAITDLGELPSK